MKKYILFDLDGTLTDPEEGITKCVAYALEDLGYKVEDLRTLRKFIGPPLADSFMQYYGFTKEQADAAIAKYRERFSPIGVFENRVYEGIPEMLDKLVKAGKVLALSTSKPWVFAEKILDKFELSGYFTVIVGSELDGRLTDKADVIAETLSRLGVGEDDKPSCIMVGDRLHDVRGAKKTGIECLGVYYGFAEKGELESEGAEYIAKTVKDTENILLSL